MIWYNFHELTRNGAVLSVQEETASFTFQRISDIRMEKIMIYRVYVEKKEGFGQEAKSLLSDVREILGVKGVEDIRILNRYDVEDIEEELFKR